MTVNGQTHWSRGRDVEREIEVSSKQKQTESLFHTNSVCMFAMYLLTGGVRVQWQRERERESTARSREGERAFVCAEEEVKYETAA